MRGPTAAAIASGSAQRVTGSMSTSTGVAPAVTTALADATKVNDGTITSPRMPRASTESWSAEVHEFIAMA